MVESYNFIASSALSPFKVMAQMALHILIASNQRMEFTPKVLANATISAFAIPYQATKNAKMTPNFIPGTFP